MTLNKIDRGFLGHPRGLSTLFFTEMWERFSYYGMRAILLYYLYYSVTDGGLGFSKATAASIVSIYGSLVYLSSISGGFVSDRIMGRRKTVFIGGVLIMFGHIALALPFGKPALFSSLALIIVGTGFLKPNISSMVGDLYSENDPRRDSGFSIFVFGINFGAFVAPYAIGYLGQEVNFHLGFSLAAIGMFFGLVKYIIDGNKYLPEASNSPSDPISNKDLKPVITKALAILGLIIVIILAMAFTNSLTVDNIINLLTFIAILVPVIYFVIMIKSKKVNDEERSRVWAYIPLFISSMIFWSIEEQGSTILALFADEQTRLSIDIFGTSIPFPASFFQSINPLFVMLYVPFFAWLWTKLGTKQPSSPAKFSLGLVFAGLSFIWMIIPISLYGTDIKIGPLWLVASWALVIIGEMLISPIGLSVTTKLAPKAFQSQMMSMWFLSSSTALALNAQLVKFYTKETEISYFGVVGGITILLGILLMFYVPKITKLMSGIK